MIASRNPPEISLRIPLKILPEISVMIPTEISGIIFEEIYSGATRFLENSLTVVLEQFLEKSLGKIQNRNL